MSWLLATTLPSKEDLALSSATGDGHECFLPLYERVTVRAGRKVRRTEPVFLRYMFVRITAAWPRLMRSRGICGVAKVDEVPLPIPEVEIGKLRSRLDGRGLFVMPRRPSGRFAPGQRVCAAEGPLAHVEGLYEGALPGEREAALFEMMGRCTRVEFKAGVLLAA